MNKDKVQNQNILGTLVNKDESGIIAYSDQIYDKKVNKSLEEENIKQDKRLDNTEAKDRELQSTLESITKTGEASAASNVTYNHNDSQLDASNVQQAIDEVYSKGNTNRENTKSELEKSIQDIYKKSNYNDGNEVIDFNTIHIIKDNPEFVMAIVDADDTILYGIKSDGQPYWGFGVPKVVRDYVDEQINNIIGTNNITETIDSLKEVEKFLSDFKNSDTLKTLLDTKANKTDVNNAIANTNADVANKYGQINTDIVDRYKKSNPNDDEGNIIDTNELVNVKSNKEYIYAIIDNTDTILAAIDHEGKIYYGNGIPPQVVEAISANNSSFTENIQDIYSKSNIAAADGSVKNTSEVMVETNKDEYAFAVLDSDGNILLGVKYNGDFVTIGDVPNTVREWVKNYVSEIISPRIKDFTPTQFTNVLTKARDTKLTIPAIIRPTDTDLLITISNQKEFDSMNDTIKSNLAAGKINIVVYIKEGTYYYGKTSSAIDLTSLNYPTANISIIGNNVTLIGSGNDYNISNADNFIGGCCVLPYSDTFDINHYFCDSNNNLIDIINNDRYTIADNLITIADETNGIFKIDNTPYNDLTEEECINVKIKITQRYQQKIYSVKKIENHAIYFVYTNSDSAQSRLNYLNADKSYSRLNPRYKLINYPHGNNVCVSKDKVYVPTKYTSVHEATNKYSFIEGNNCHLNSISISNLHFGVTSKVAINLFLMTCNSILIENNSFDGCSNCIQGSRANIHINKCSFKTIYSDCVYLNQGASDSEVTNCTFFNTGFGNAQHAVVSWCDNFYIADNVFRNFRGCAIQVGGIDADRATALVERNLMYNDDDFFNDRYENGLTEESAVYVYFENTNIIVRNNIVYNFTALYDFSGLAVDDGGDNVIFYGNLVLGVTGGVTHGDSLHMREATGKGNDLHNTNNVMLYNIIDTPYRIGGSKDVAENNCIKGLNFLLCKTGLDNRVSNVQYSEDDYIITDYRADHGTVYLPTTCYNIIEPYIDKFILKNIHKFN